jgi:NADPH2:quinone reductase
MKAWLIEKDGAAARLVLREVADLVPGPDDLLIGVRAVGLNRADLGLNAGHYGRIASKPPHPIAGLEAAGEVIGVGANVSGWSVGERVMGMPAGAYAEQALIDHRLAVRMPAGFDFAQAAAIPVALFTAHDAVVSAGRLAKGEALFIQGAASGVGIAATQIAREIGASAIIGTASAGKQERLRALGLTHGIDYTAGGVVEAVLAATGGVGADVILDMVGA